MKKGLALCLAFCMMMDTAAWAQEITAQEMTAFQKQVVEELPEFHYAYFVSEGETVKTGSSQSGLMQTETMLTAKPYINRDGVLMVAVEDLGEFLGFGKTRKVTYWDENRKRVDVVVENSVSWDEETKKTTIEVPWRIASYCTPVFGTEMWILYQEGDIMPKTENNESTVIAKALKEVNTPIDVITSVTGLSKEEVEKL